MKKLFILSVLSAVVLSSVWAQDIKPPKTGAIIHVDQHQFNLKPGGEISFSALLIKSKSAKKMEFGDLSIKGTDQVTFQIAPSADRGDLYLITAKAKPDVAAGKLYFVLKMTGKNSYKVRSTTLSFAIDHESIVESN